MFSFLVTCGELPTPFLGSFRGKCDLFPIVVSLSDSELVLFRFQMLITGAEERFSSLA